MIYAAFCGTGKSYLCTNYPDKYKELECWEYRNADFPNNYITEILNSIEKCEYLFDRFIDRNSPYDFIGTIMKHWNIWINELKEQKYCKHIILEKGQYLQDIL